MGSALGVGLALGGLSAATSLIGSAGQANQQRQQARMAEAQASEYRRQAELQKQAGEVEAANIERRKIELRREFQEKEARNRNLLAAGNVDMTSGSALDVSLGNINRFAADIGDNAWDKALSQWETRNRVNSLEYQARTSDAQASWLKRSAQSFLGPSLLTAGISGATSFISGYSMAGGRFSRK